MSEIEVVRVDDERPYWCCTGGERRAHTFAGGHANDNWLPPEDRRAIVLAALLEDARAVKCCIEDGTCINPIPSDGEYYVLSIPEDTP